MNYTTLRWNKTGNKVQILLNRPEVYNAINIPILQELAHALTRAEKDPDIRVIVLGGEGKGFCAGQDLAAVGDTRSLNAGDIILDYYEPVIKAIVQNKKAVIGRLHGKAAGAGLALLLSCDCIIAAQSSVLVPGFCQIGLMPDSGITYFLLKTLGPKLTFEFLAAGEHLSAGRAKELTCINQVVPDDTLDEAVASFSDKIAAGSGQIICMLKELISQGGQSSLDEIIRIEAVMQTTAALSPDFEEGIKAFKEKRPPRFSGL